MLTFLLSSCASSTGVINFNSDERVTAKIKRLNIVSRDRPCEIWLKNGQKHFGKKLIVKAGSTTWEDSTKVKNSILTTEISKIELGKKSRSNFTLKFMLISGLIAGITTANNEPAKHFSKVPTNFLLGILGLGVGAFVGVLFDSFANSDKTETYTFSFEDFEEPNKMLK